MTPHLPVLRFGRPYESLATAPILDAATGRPLATISVANAGLIRRDLRGKSMAAAALRRIPTADLIGLCRRAADFFMQGDLPFGNSTQHAQGYVRSLSAVSGLPHNLCRDNMEKIRYVLAHMDEVIGGLTRGLEQFDAIDRGVAEHRGTPLSYVAETDALAVVLPSNSPGVNSIWLPALALRTPTLIKPGREEPLTPWRIVQSLLAAGFPPEAFGFYPADHEGADALVHGCERAICFGDDRTLARYAGHPGMQGHGTGRSKIILAPDVVDRWESFLDVIVTSMVANGGRSCINVSSLFVPRHAEAIAEAIAQRVASIEPRPLDNDEAVLSAFANERMAAWVDQSIDGGLAIPGACDITASLRAGPRRANLGGLTFLRPTVIRCDGLDHPLANTEYMFPFISVVEVDADTLMQSLGPTLVATVITDDPAWREVALRTPGIERLNLGPMATTQVHWDQPHEGNLFDFLYRRRAIQWTA